MEIKVNFKKVFYQLFSTWAVCRGSLILLVVMGIVIPCTWLPFLGLALIVPVMAFSNYNLSRGNLNCSLETHFTVYSLIVSSIIMFVINILNTKWFHWGIGAQMHDPQPFISALIVYPVSMVLFGYAYIRHMRTNFCKVCKEQHTYSVKMTIECNVFTKEAMQQIRTHLVMSTLVSIATWTYYFCFYINVNINTPDTFIFFIVPLVVFLFSLVYYGLRYSNMQFEASISPRHLEHDSSAKLRFIVVGDDKILLQEVVKDKSGVGLWDTPAVAEVPFTLDVDDAEARNLFKEISGVDNFDVRFLFSFNTSKSMVYHYAAFVPTEEKMPGLEGEWFNLYQIDMMMKAGLVLHTFSFEMHRIFTITMAWKTYDREGRRLYPIKNYRPTFRLKDFKDWDVDYGDLHWLNVSKNNEDRPFFRLRKFWRNYISGADLRWKKRRL